MTSPLSTISGEFVKTCSIQAVTKSQNAFGEEQEVWNNVTSMVDINCIVSRGNGTTKGEVQRDNMTVIFTPLQIRLLDAYTGITTLHRVVFESEYYQILDVWTDQLNYSTVLQVYKSC